MKFTFKPSPNYRSGHSTSTIMRDLTTALLAVLVFAIVWHGVCYGASYALRIVLMTVFAVAAALFTEAAFFAFSNSQNILKDLSHSYSWVTAIIIVLITKIDVSYYAIVIATVLAIVFAKLVFGGFGQNVFNPAAVGEAIIMNTFSASTSKEVTATVLSGATPLSTMASQGWGLSGSAFGNVLSSFGGMTSFLMGNYASVIGGSCALFLVACAVYLIVREVIDWRITVSYICTIFVVSLVVGLVHGGGFSYALFNVVTGGTMFAAVFMLTDPVTSPVSISGRYLFAVCAACLTLILRWKASIPDGALFSILLMNMLTPAIEKLCDGSQIKDAGKIQRNVCIVAAVSVVVALLVGITL